MNKKKTITIAVSTVLFSTFLFANDFKSATYKKNYHPAKEDFIEFGIRIGIHENRIKKLLEPFLKKQQMIDVLIKHSFLNNSAKKVYQLHYNTRRNYLTA